MSVSDTQSTVAKAKLFLFTLLIACAALAGLLTYQYLQHDFETLDGKTYRWKGLEGQWVVVNYFAPWCAPCLREMPELAIFNSLLPEKTQLFAINYDPKSASELAEMTKEFNITIPVIVSSPDTKLPMKKPPYLPATFIIGPDGKVIDTIMGELTAAHLKQRLETLKGANK